MSRELATRRGHHRGYVLLEALVGLVIVGAGLAVMLVSLSSSLRASGHGRHLTLATFLAEEKLGELRVVPPRVIGVGEGDFGEAFPGYRWRSLIRPVGDGSWYTLELSVRWQEAGRERDATFFSLLPGLPDTEY